VIFFLVCCCVFWYTIRLTLNPNRVKFIPTDVISWESQLAAFKTTLAWTSSRLDIVIPNAGVGAILSKESFSGLSPTEDPQKPPTLVLEVNLLGVYYTAILAVHYFNARIPDEKFKPQLCFVSSLAGYAGLPFKSDYCAAKWGVRGIWRSLRGERGVNGLGGTQANLIAPTYVRTAMTASYSGALEEAGVKIAEVGDVVQAILRVVADDAIDGMY
jgi:5'-hydroxyaverantin dehydrogenase